ncbi:D-2-hydroxyacid dehydrogenase family protein [Pseudomonas baetica]|uniref:D-2-hydroxyacid dehydrogenase family protein n=1 Tax=Pseudomonas baetica TaxID=674054 RepID=UPI002406CBAD|nr:D-2-hydroxyacid dehydrogenase family protein [Pseudomonas baetica]MDF9773165.1 phosphoglycerate dehydrogenase-like enzyme [Pseudomonas baetica]
MRVAVLNDIHNAYKDTAGIRRLREHAQVEIFTEPLSGPGDLKGFDAVIANRERTLFSAQFMEQLPDLRIIAQTGNHAYHIDLNAAQKLNIVIAKATGGFCTSAGEFTFGLMMALMREIPWVDSAVKRGEWPTPMTRVLRGKTLGIVGLGNIGRYVAQVAQVFGMNVVAWGPRLKPEDATAVGAKAMELDDLMRQSDIVSVHATLAPESRGLLDARRLGLMKPSAYIVNTARGPIIDEAALVQALAEHRICGAALDVFDQEPLPKAHALTSLPNVILTSHLGWPTDEMYAQFANAAADALLAWKEGVDIPRFLPHH